MRAREMRDLPEHETTTWVYYVSRDSLDGALSAKCTLWNEKPVRVKVKSRVVWVDGTRPNGHLGEYRPEQITAWFRTYPESDRELLRVETRPSKAELDEAQRKAGLK